jgi:hypothetical protein
MLQAALWLRWRDPASLWWAAADGLGVVGVILLISAQWLPAWIARSMANTIIFSSGLLVWLGFRRFYGQAWQWRFFAAGALLYFAVFELLRSFVNDLAPLIVFASFGHGLPRAGVAVDLVRSPLPADQRRLRAALTTVFVVQALFYLFRSATAVTVDSGAAFLNTKGVQSVTVLVSLLSVLLWNAGTLLMVGHRYRTGAAVQMAA